MTNAALAFQNYIEANVAMEFLEPYHSLPIREWRKYMKARPRSCATSERGYVIAANAD
jgi:hypothetical protein